MSWRSHLQGCWPSQLQGWRCQPLSRWLTAPAQPSRLSRQPHQLLHQHGSHHNLWPNAHALATHWRQNFCKPCQCWTRSRANSLNTSHSDATPNSRKPGTHHKPMNWADCVKVLEKELQAPIDNGCEERVRSRSSSTMTSPVRSEMTSVTPESCASFVPTKTIPTERASRWREDTSAYPMTCPRPLALWSWSSL